MRGGFLVSGQIEIAAGITRALGHVKWSFITAVLNIIRLGTGFYTPYFFDQLISMKKAFHLSGLIVAVALVFSASCSKSDSGTPTITVTNPTAGANITRGSSLNVTGAAGGGGLHELTIKITKDADNSELLLQFPSVFNKSSYDYSVPWTAPNVTASTPCTLFVEIENHSGKKTQMQVKFNVVP